MRITFLLLFILVLTNFGHSQEEPRVIVFKPDDNRNAGLGGYNEPSNVLKIGFAEMFLGDYSLFYERSIADFASIEIGGGFTKRANPSIGAFNFDLLDEYGYDEAVISRLGSSFSFGLRLYPDIVFEDWYFSIELKLRNYNWTRSYDTYPSWDNPGEILGGDFNESIRVFYPRISSGYCIVLGDRFVLDYFTGIGLARVTNNTYSFNENEVVETRSRVPWFHIGFRFGILF